MKNYDEIANRIFERRDEYIAKRQKKRIIISVVVTEICCLVVLIAGFALWKIGIFSNNIPTVNYTQNTSNKLSSDSSVNSSKNTSTNSSNSSKDNNSASTPPNDSGSQGGFISENNTPSNNSSQDDFVFENKTPSIPDDNPSSNPSDNTSSNISSSNPNAIETNYYIDSIDKINFYSAKKIISEKSLLPIGMNCNYNPNIISLSKVYVEYPIDRNKVYTSTMATYFTIELNDEKGFLAQKLGGTGIVEVVVTENDIDDMGQMITFKREDKYYTCFANGGNYDPDSNKRSREFSSHKYIVGFNIVKNLEQENYKFTVHYDGSKVIGFECAPFHSVPTNYVVDDVTFIEDFCFVIYAKQTFTIDELEVYFKNENEPVIHKHFYTTSVVTATCSQDGYTLNKCYCGDEYISDTTSKTYRHSFSKNTHPSLGESYVSDSLGRDKCSLCGLEVIDQGYWRDGNYKKSNVRYYFTNDTFVVYGSGTIPGNTITNSSTENLSPWNDYLYDHISGFKNLTKIIIADGITEISNNAFKFPENNIKTIYISDSVKKIKNSFSGFNKVTDVRLSRNLEYLGANFSSRDHRLLINKTVLPKTLKYLSRNAFKSSGWLFYEGTEEEFSSMKIIENQDLTVIEWIKKNREAYLVAISGVTYNCDFQ